MNSNRQKAFIFSLLVIFFSLLWGAYVVALIITIAPISLYVQYRISARNEKKRAHEYWANK